MGAAYPGETASRQGLGRSRRGPAGGRAGGGVNGSVDKFESARQGRLPVGRSMAAHLGPGIGRELKGIEESKGGHRSH